MSIFTGFDDDDFNTEFKPVIFEEGEKVNFTIQDFREVEDYGLLNLTTKVLTGSNEGKTYNLTLSNKARRNFVGFLSMFWTKDEIKTGITDITKMIGETFEATATKPVEKGNKTFQNWRYFDLVEGKKTAPTFE